MLARLSNATDHGAAMTQRAQSIEMGVNWRVRLHPAVQVEIAVEQAEIARVLPAQLKLVESMSVLVAAAVDCGAEAIQGAHWPSASWVGGIRLGISRHYGNVDSSGRRQRRSGRGTGEYNGGRGAVKTRRDTFPLHEHCPSTMHSCGQCI